MNILQLADSYKYSHFNQYPKNAVISQHYFEARGVSKEFQNQFPSNISIDKVIFFGLQYYIKEYLTKEIRKKDLDKVQLQAQAHGIPFDRAGWERVARLGYLPLVIHARPEGSVNRILDPLFTVESTDEECWWVASFVETLLSKVWYPCTVATKAFYVRKMINEYYRNSGLPSHAASFAYHNFGDRGSSSVEAAAIGGAAHLLSFLGTDNFASLDFIHRYYGDHPSQGIGYSIPASEHSTVTCLGRHGEMFMIDNYLEAYSGSPMIACVLDSYDIYHAVDQVTKGSFKERIESDDYPIFVIRPDSGSPVEIINKILEIMDKNGVSIETTHHGHLFKKYRIIWGDGIDPNMISNILLEFSAQGYDPRNFAFGSGGDLMQKLNRDSLKFAFKMCAIGFKESTIDYVAWKDVGKDPVTDPGKKSKMGIIRIPSGKVVFRDGKTYNESSFLDARKRVSEGL